MKDELLEPHLWPIETLFESSYIIPIYQRPYSWEKEQVKVLLDDVYNSFINDNEKQGYYTGNIVLYDTNEKIDGHIPIYSVIDGQQRITTFSLLLLATYCISMKRINDEKDSTIDGLKEALWKKIARKVDSSKRAITLNSIEKNCLEKLFDACFKNPKKIEEYCNNYKCENDFENRIISNFLEIYRYVDIKIPSSGDEILDFADYILSYIKVIAIGANCKPQEVFNMFESINSKGKQLQEIDKIKTYIFSKLDENSYDDYSNKWGQLIIKTDDELYEYILTFIRAYFTYYRISFNLDNFKKTICSCIKAYYKAKDEGEGLKKFIDDLYDKIDYYLALENREVACSYIDSSKYKFYINFFIKMGYRHAKPLIFRTLVEYKNGNIKKEDVIEIIQECIAFSLKAITIGDRESKDQITMYSDMMNEIIVNNKIDKDKVIDRFEIKLFNSNINLEYLTNQLLNVNGYEKKEWSVPLLALYQSTTKEENKDKNEITYHTSYDNACSLVEHFSEFSSEDHLLVQTPKEADEDFKYYKDKITEKLVLKKGHDFPEDLVFDGMPYEIFQNRILDKVGNLRILYQDTNSLRSNSVLILEDGTKFNTYAKIVERNKDIAETVFEHCMPSKKVDIKTIPDKTKDKDYSSIKMDQLIELGFISPNDEVEILGRDNSKAILIDNKHVLYNNEKLTLNDWGKKITGWTSIRIYEYMRKCGEEETLQDKRDAYLKEQEDMKDE